MTLTVILSLMKGRGIWKWAARGIEGEVRDRNGGLRLRGRCPHPRAPGALALSLDREVEMDTETEAKIFTLVE